jgi:Na+/H+ antiporter NhaB
VLVDRNLTVVWLVRHITTATNTVTAAAVTTTNTITMAATTATTTVTAANAIAAFVLLMTSQISDNVQIYWHRYAWLILVFFILRLPTVSLSV